MHTEDEMSVTWIYLLNNAAYGVIVEKCAPVMVEHSRHFKRS